ncbi:MAG: type II toxin-antitoxin system prevent-host-death family antitoxin [Actinomycetota bacterium]|nr:type II toxin-antitoxin system prevent-host-death family antitoxin [Actinomycetota bacterium]
MRRVAAGESFTVTVHGQPVADLVPHQRFGHRRRRLVPAAEFDAALAALPPLDVEQWKRDLSAADDVFGDDLWTDPWNEVRRLRHASSGLSGVIRR